MPENPLPAGRWRGRLPSVIAALGTALALGGGLLTAAHAEPTSSAAAQADRSAPLGLTVKTPYGAVRGRELDGAQAFLGMPFAQPPVYDLAWKAPVEPERWSGLRDATEQEAACLQFQPTGVKNDQPTSLDCLYLDVYRPSRIRKGEKLPVLVFYHGGAGTQGSGVLYGGQTMADRNDVIVVSTNYRLGAAGNLALPGLDAENAAAGGNFALLDQVEALTWVRKSIGAFGGDPSDVTVFGQSAGARAVCNLLATPLAEGLFDSAIMQSSPCLGGGTTQARAHQNGEAFADAVGCAPGDEQLTCLRKAWPASLVQAFATDRPSGYVGTSALPQASGDAISSGNWNKVPVIVGNTRWEQKLQNQQHADISAAEYEAMVIDQFGETAGRIVLEEYPASDYERPFYALAAMRTDAGAGCTVDVNADLFLGQDVPVYRYHFDDPTSPTLFGFQPEGIDMSSAHSGELAYLFDFTLGDRPLTAQQQKLGDSMQAYWAAFARSGKPQAKGEVTWPRHTADGDKALRLAPRIEVITGLRELHNCEFFENLP
ncbi:carboxylesterase family protein [Nocardioides sp.]|uniref:carboxylesterase/lipase family protein n=1 Tax=Nocardioides sp. TaxID=35761 RepID=UPI00199BDC43|nr:carboxylesterase family protein [Nocardioides sp.]MBC7279194.1 carboxylesterase family protein [Nocardioides sp.]